ncbi:hypothetical protein MAMMFC1_03338 [Methylomusa anaerophila]|uniref:Uncharacterized protein n=2 Tax=Methylomusa anaerophila TaxID=1930071 RepID=A0A348ANJ5_9FIRM|nr:hypothetical protein MAMMFC1_03338 [Methylomusa anaerophila]
MRDKALKSINEETVTGLEQAFEAKLAALRVYEQKLEGISDPYARKTLDNLIVQEQAQLLHLADLIDLVEQSPGMSKLARTQRRISHQMRSPAGKSVVLGLGAAVLGFLLLPTVRKALHPVAVKAMQGIMEFSEQAQGMMAGVKEDIEDLVSEAEFERFKTSFEIPEVNPEQMTDMAETIGPDDPEGK